MTTPPADPGREGLAARDALVRDLLALPAYFYDNDKRDLVASPTGALRLACDIRAVIHNHEAGCSVAAALVHATGDDRATVLRDAAERVWMTAEPVTELQGTEDVVIGYRHKTGAMHALKAALDNFDAPHLAAPGAPGEAAKVERSIDAEMRAALWTLKDFFDLGETVFNVSNRWPHAKKVIDDICEAAGISEPPSVGAAGFGPVEHRGPASADAGSSGGSSTSKPSAPTRAPERPTRVRVTKSRCDDITEGLAYDVRAWSGGYPVVPFDDGQVEILTEADWEPAAPPTAEKDVGALRVAFVDALAEWWAKGETYYSSLPAIAARALLSGLEGGK